MSKIIAVLAQNPELFAKVAAALGPLLPFVMEWLSKEQKPHEPAIVPPKRGPTPVEIDEEIEPLPNFREPADPINIGRAILEIQGFIHENGGIVAFPDVTRDLDGRQIGEGGWYWAEKMNRRVLNARTKVLVTPTVYSVSDRELNSNDWDQLNWKWNIRYFAAVDPDPDNPESVSASGVSGFVGDGTPTTTITVDPKGADANVGGERYRNGKGRAATIMLFSEGKWTLWAELPGGVLTEKVHFVVR